MTVLMLLFFAVFSTKLQCRRLYCTCCPPVCRPDLRLYVHLQVPSSYRTLYASFSVEYRCFSWKCLPGSSWANVSWARTAVFARCLKVSSAVSGNRQVKCEIRVVVHVFNFCWILLQGLQHIRQSMMLLRIW